MQEFQKQSAQMDMTTEMMSDAIDDALDNDEAEDETEELTNQFNQRNDAKTCSPVHKDKLNMELCSMRLAWMLSHSSGVDDLEERLAALRNP
ncbi:hypothetical protein RIF29_20092 [Crotalaria pallida]|uniref:Uncharacterized protein n=1 Tax=Crotalaria pallida TaxID=3830 RepID=A0AAN9F4V6_CROPI